MEPWQLVHSDGEVDDIDDDSSISSDWSIMNMKDDVEFDEALEDKRSLSRLSTPSTPRQEPRQPDPASRQQRSRRHRRHLQQRAPVPARPVSTVTILRPPPPLTTPAELSARVALLALASAQRHPHTSDRPPSLKYANNRPCADRKHTKCIFNGAMVGLPHQRPQVFRGSGGQVSRGNKLRA
ncbi:unnamed protein product [Mesocestoides corti]|uniref:Uncharacterized protein n=1 Tax=Mesocestoides corti TaxID=53468 RepID=A0A0R3U6U0_MESCO|nr:unnamed protein product [Mesocestoides corti]